MSGRFAQQRNDRGGRQRSEGSESRVGMNHGDGLIKRSGSSNIHSPSSLSPSPIVCCFVPDAHIEGRRNERVETLFLVPGSPAGQGGDDRLSLSRNFGVSDAKSNGGARSTGEMPGDETPGHRAVRFLVSPPRSRSWRLKEATLRFSPFASSIIWYQLLTSWKDQRLTA